MILFLKLILLLPLAQPKGKVADGKPLKMIALARRERKRKQRTLY